MDGKEEGDVMVDIFAWTGAGLLTALILWCSGAFVIELIRSELGRGLLMLGAVLVIVIWGILGVLWLVGTEVV